MSSNAGPTVNRILLPVWDQCTIRAYIQLAFCFSFSAHHHDHNNSNHSTTTQEQQAEAHIRASLQRLSRQRPELAARLCADEQGRVWLEQRADHVIPFDVRQETTLGGGIKSYAELKRKEFPPGAFVHPDLAISGALEPGGASKPVVKIELSFLEDGSGIILWVNTHHTLVDGDSCRCLVQCLAAQTRGEELACPGNVDPAPLRSLEDGHHNTDFADLIRQFPEYGDLPERNGPNVVAPSCSTSHHPSPGSVGQKAERILVFRQEALKRLGGAIASAPAWTANSRRSPSSYLSLAVLTWAHITKARVTAFANRAGSIDPKAPAKLTTHVDWRRRVFEGTFQDYLGNAIAIPFTQFPVEELIDAADAFSNRTGTVNDKLSHIAYCIQQTNDSVDQDFVAVRTQAMAACKSDPRRFGLGVDPTDPTCLGFNTWRFLGSDAVWGIPGTPISRPDAVRRVGDKIGVERALILPQVSDEKVEMLVWLTQDAMELLLQDEGFMRWVDHVVE